MDTFSPEVRSHIMRQVKGANTRLERQFIEALAASGADGISFHRTDLPGTPDVVHNAARIAVFIDSCYWHGCPQHLRMPASNRAYWTKKIARNRRRDRTTTRALRDAGWLVVRIWEHSIRNPRSLRWRLTRLRNLIDQRTSGTA